MRAPSSQGDVLNIQAELVDTANESQLWGEQFRQKVSDLLTVQEEIAWQISEALRLKLSGEQKKKLRKRPTIDAEAYQEYLRGRYHWHNWSPEGFPRALEHFGRAIAIDPAYAQAYAGLGNTYSAMAYYGFVPPDEGFPLARAAAARALELDPDQPEAHVTLAIALLFHGWDWEGAEREFKRALSGDDKLGIAHSMYALLLSTWGRHDEAIASARRARDLDPLSLVINMGVAWACFFGGRHEEALQEGRRTREIAPGFEEAGNAMISAYEELGRYEEAAAIMHAQRCYGIQFDGDALIAALRSGGERAYWRTRLEQLAQPTSTAPHAVHLASAIAHVHLGEADAALDHLEAMVDNHLAGAVWVAVNPCLVSLRGHPRYEAVIKKLGVPLRRGASAPHTVST